MCSSSSMQCESSVIITVSPGLDYKQQTYNTLHFGKSAMSVEVCAVTLSYYGIMEERRFDAYLKQTSSCSFLEKKIISVAQESANPVPT